MHALFFPHEIMRLMLLAECERTRRFHESNPGRCCSILVAMLPAPIKPEQMKVLTERLVAKMRVYDVISVQGEQYLLMLLPETSASNAVRVAARVKEMLAEPLATFGMNTNYIRISIAWYGGGEKDEYAPVELIPIALKAAPTTRPGSVQVLNAPKVTPHDE